MNKLLYTQDECTEEKAGQNHRLRGYFRIEKSLYGEQLVGLLFQQSKVGHDVILGDPCRGAQCILCHRAVTLHLREDAAHSCEMGETGVRGTWSSLFVQCNLL